MDQATVSRWRSGDRVPDLLSLASICREYRVSADELLGIERPEGALLRVDLPLPGEWAAIPRVSEQVAAGSALYDEATVGERDWYVFRERFLRHLLGRSAAAPGVRLVVVTVARNHRGESMLPTICPGALVLIDRGPGGRGIPDPEDGKIYLCRPRPEEGVTLKRVFRAGSRALMLWSDNPMQKPISIEFGAGDRVQDYILGRVRWIGQEES